MILFLKMFLAHLLGDFLFQPTRWVNEKEILTWKSKYLYFHILVHGTLLFLLVWDLRYWRELLLLTLSHFLVDLSKLLFQKENTKRLWFFVDQILHVLFLTIAWVFISGNSDYKLEQLITEKSLIYVVAILFLTKTSGLIIKMTVSRWVPEASPNQDSLQNAGEFIGFLERLLVFFFICIQHWEGVGLLLGAKSVFRFGDLKEAKDRKLTEYVMIGTLLSFGIAMLTGFVVQEITKL